MNLSPVDVIIRRQLKEIKAFKLKSYFLIAMNIDKLTRRAFLKSLSLGCFATFFSYRKARPMNQEILRIATPPSLASLPLRLANLDGMFEKNGLKVEFNDEIVSRPSLQRKFLTSGQLDCIISDISGVLFEIANAYADIVITSTAFERVENTKTLALLGSGYNHMKCETMENLLSRIDRTPENSILIPRYTDMEFATDKLLNEEYGFKVDEQIAYTEVEDLTYSILYLLTGKRLASVLPEPLATLTGEKNAAANGGTIRDGEWAYSLSNYQEIELMPAVIVFRGEIIRNKPYWINNFLTVYRKSIQTLNSTSNELLRGKAKNIGVELFRKLYYSTWEAPEGFEEIFTVPEFPPPRALRKSEFAKVFEWATKKGYIRNQKLVSYQEAFNGSFLL